MNRETNYISIAEQADAQDIVAEQKNCIRSLGTIPLYCQRASSRTLLLIEDNEAQPGKIP